MTAEATIATETEAETERRLGLYRAMLRIRRIEDAIAERYADQEMRCPVHLSVGQEAAAVGACAPLRADDVVTSSHRCHSHYLAKGGSLERMLAEIHGKAAGCSGGRGGSMHLFDTEAGVLASVPIVGSSVPLAVGAALAFRQRGEDRVAVAFLGDGSIEEGAVHESLNLASINSFPVIFFCENNCFSVYTHLSERQPNRPMTDVGRAHAVPSLHVDGNDVDAVTEAETWAVERARAGDGPSLIVADTYRWREHCGPNYDDDLGYRAAEEFAHWKARDPVDGYARALRVDGTLSDALDAAFVREIDAEIDAAFAFARAAPFPAAGTAGAGVYG